METKYLIVMFCLILVGALYAATNISPNKYKSSEALLSSAFWGLSSISLSLLGCAAIFGFFHQSVGKGIAAIFCLLLGFFLSWYFIKIPERRYLKEQH